MINITYIGARTTIPGWPEHDTLAGLFDALRRWTLDPRLDNSQSPRLEPHPLRAPFRHPCLRYAGKRYDVQTGLTVYISGDPIYPESPNAVGYCGNFLGYSFGFYLDTDEPELIARLDAAIAENMRRPEYIAAAASRKEA